MSKVKKFFEICLNVILVIWQIPQYLVGWLLSSILIPDAFDRMGRVSLLYSKNMTGGVSFAGVVLLAYHYFNDGEDMDERHEYGHSKQSLVLGPLYLLVIGIPSVVWALFYNVEKHGGMDDYYKFYTEAWADKWGGVERVENK